MSGWKNGERMLTIECPDCQDHVQIRYFDFAMMTDDCRCPQCGVMIE